MHWSERLDSGPASLPATPVSWQTFANTFYGAPLHLLYHGLAMGGTYSVTVVCGNVNVYMRGVDAAVGGVGGVGATSAPPPMTRLTANGFEVRV